jgi:hypothetical protein
MCFTKGVFSAPSQKHNDYDLWLPIPSSFKTLLLKHTAWGSVWFQISQSAEPDWKNIENQLRRNPVVSIQMPEKVAPT